MGTTRIKVIDLSSEEKQIKTSRKHAEKLTGAAKIKEPGKKKVSKGTKESKEVKEQEGKKVDKVEEKSDEEAASEEKSATAETAEKKTETEEKKSEKDAKTSASSAVARKRTRGTKYQNAKKQIENKPYKVKEAIELLPKTSISKFDGAVEIHLNVVEKNIKGNVSFPHSFAAKQKQTKYLVFSDSKKEIKGAEIIWANDQTVSDIESGKLKPGKDFDAVVASPGFMPKLAKVAKILGPRGMMPNPKNGTVTEDIEKVIGAEGKGYQFKTDPTAPIVHAKIGKLSQKSAEIEENLKTLITAIGSSKIKKATITSTMGPGVKLDIASF